MDSESERVDKERVDEERLVKGLVMQYVYQLSYGCNERVCEQQACATGRRNTSKRPVRDYTPRSIRGIALAIVNGREPRSRLCQYYDAGRHAQASSREEGPLDPGSFMQLLCETERIKKLCNPRAEAFGPERFDTETQSATEELKVLHDHLDRIACRDLRSWNVRTARQIFDVFAWLTERLVVPQASGIGFESFDSLQLQDRLEDRASFRLLCRALDMAGARFLGEYRDRQTRCSTGFLDFMREPAGIFTVAFLHQLGDIVLRDETAGDDMKTLIEARWFALGAWLDKAFLHHWSGDPFLSLGSIPATALAISETMSDTLSRTFRASVFRKCLLIPAISARMSLIRFSQAYQRRPSDSLHIFEFEAPFTIEEKALFFRSLCHIQMREVNSTARKYHSLRTNPFSNPHTAVPNADIEDLEAQYLLLSVRRDDALKDAMDQLWHRDVSELRHPLRVRLGEMEGGEVGHDLGGVQTEFFNIMCKEMFKEGQQLFTTDANTGLSYFRPGSLQPIHQFELVGVLFGLALYNGIPLPVSLPLAFYHMLLGFHEPKQTLLDDGWPEYARSLTAVEGLDAVFPLETNGLRLSIKAEDSLVRDGTTGDHARLVFNIIEATRLEKSGVTDGTPAAFTGEPDSAGSDVATGSGSIDIASIETAWPGLKLVACFQAPSEVTASNAQWYARSLVSWLTRTSVRPQLDAFIAGFERVIQNATLRVLSPETLKAVMEGSDHLDIDELRLATEYDEYSPQEEYIQDFWTLVTSWPVDKQKQLVKFVTAAERIPAGGASSLTFRISKAALEEDMEHLPTSSTCFGTLSLPHYPTITKLDEKLSMAIEFGSEGFGQA